MVSKVVSLCRRWRYRPLSYRQAMLPPMAIKLEKWSFSVISVQGPTFHGTLIFLSKILVHLTIQTGSIQCLLPGSLDVLAPGATLRSRSIVLSGRVGGVHLRAAWVGLTTTCVAAVSMNGKKNAQCTPTYFVWKKSWMHLFNFSLKQNMSVDTENSTFSSTLKQTETSSMWLPWSSLGTLKLAFNISSDRKGSHPGDLSVSM